MFISRRIFKRVSPPKLKQKLVSSKFVYIKKWGQCFLLLNLGSYGISSINRVEMPSCDLWSWIIKGHVAFKLLAGILSSGALSHHAKHPTTQDHQAVKKPSPMEMPCAIAQSQPCSSSYPIPGTRHGSEQAARWFQPSEVKSSQASSRTSSEVPDYKVQGQATPSVRCLNFWATKSISIMKCFF